ncbi:hypothetical protein M1L60_33370 [Actinoplanes sp. TRM 88003]|uniref:Uncharacterized protein n=1 Tax=Paractinoplanes aksuensis TaxID=2939490 RepID=A0ABT1DZZ4_9ACTN|nr:hypothetical protein [Actinoplanes aksuensis]MCO8275485.1 hypothetical protein [Actinoplanes aksuensis]
MTRPDEVESRLHHMLLRLAGWLPDQVTAGARMCLAEGRPVDTANAVLGTLVADRLPVAPVDAEVLVRLLASEPALNQLAGLPVASLDVHPAFDFVPRLPGP